MKWWIVPLVAIVTFCAASVLWAILGFPQTRTSLMWISLFACAVGISWGLMLDR